MGSPASDEIMVNQLVSLLQAEHAAAAITTNFNFFSFPENTTAVDLHQQSSLKPFFCTSTEPPHYLSQQSQPPLLFSLKPPSLLHFPSSLPSTTATSSDLW